MKCFTVSEGATKGIVIQDEPFLRVGAEGFCSRVPLCRSLADMLEELKLVGVDKLDLEHADFSNSLPLRIVPARRGRNGKLIPEDTALVHVTTKSPGQLWFTSNCYDEVIVPTKYSSRVRRDYRVFPGAGVAIVAIGTGANGEPNALLRMWPGASFRICRDTLDLPAELVVVWPGTRLKVIVPRKYRGDRQQALGNRASRNVA